jgi:hypothetical protein
MQRRFLLLVPLALLPTLHAARAPAAAPALGPGAVLDMHEALLAAAEHGAVVELQGLMFDGGELGWCFEAQRKDGHPGVFQSYLPSDTGSAGNAGSARVERQDDAGARLAAWGLGWKPEIVAAWADCGSATLSFCAFELVRKRGAGAEAEIERWLGTSLVSYQDGAEAGWKIRHLHLSPAELAADAPAAAGERAR